MTWQLLTQGSLIGTAGLIFAQLIECLPPDQPMTRRERMVMMVIASAIVGGAAGFLVAILLANW